MSSRVGTGAVASGGGSGGAATTETLVKVTRTRFSANHNFTDEDDFEDIAGMIAWGANTKRAFINFGGDDENQAGTAQWARIEKAEFDAFIVADAGSSPADTTGSHFRDFTSNSPSSITTISPGLFHRQRRGRQVHLCVKRSRRRRLADNRYFRGRGRHRRCNRRPPRPRRWR